MYYAQKYILVFLLFASQLLFNIWLTTDVFEYPKFLTLIFITGVLTALNLFDVIKNGHVGIFLRVGRARRIVFFFLLLLFIGDGIALLFSENPTVSFVGADTRFQGFLSHIYYLLLFLNTLYFFRRYPQSKTNHLFFWLLILLFVVDALAVLPFLFPMTFPFYFFTPAFFYDRVYGTFGNPNYLASFLITLLPFLVFRLKTFYGDWFHREEGKWRALGLWAFFVFTLVVLFLTGSRSAWLASILGFLVLGIFEVVSRKKYKILGFTLGITFLLVLGIFAKPYITSSVLGRLTLDTAQSTSLQTRFHLWKAGFEMFLRKPFTGYGQEMIKGNIESYLPDYLKKNQVFFIDRTHSEFIDILVTGGIFAFIGYVGFLLAIFLKSMLKSIQGGVSPALIAFFTLVLFQAVNFSTISSNVFLYFLAAYLTSSFGEKRIGV